MAEESVQKWLGRNRPPRVQITYDLETRGAIEKKELPLVVGIIAPLYGDTEQDAKSYREGKFIEIDVDNFDEVMRKIAPTFVIPETNPKQTLNFSSVDDFTPDSIVQSAYLKDLLEQRQYLTDLLGRADGNDQLCKDLLAIYTDATNKGNLIAALKKVPPVSGTLTVTNGALTVTLDDGTVIPVTADKAKVSGARTATTALATGDKVTVKGSVDGGLTTITATEIVVKAAAAAQTPSPEKIVTGVLTKDAAPNKITVTPAEGSGTPMTLTFNPTTTLPTGKTIDDLASKNVKVTYTDAQGVLTAKTIEAA
jgi:type VI secretion system protein ImpB